MKILITGAAGFIGSHVAEACLEAGHEVVIIDDLSTGERKNLPDGVRFYQKNIHDPEIHSIFEKERPQAVNHHAAQIDLRKSVTDPVHDAEINVLGTLNILEASRKTGVKKIIFASSAAVYGEQEVYPATENHPLKPLTPYGITKLAVEGYLRFYQLHYHMQTVLLRYSNVYGPRQNILGDAGVISAFTSRLMRGESPLIYGDGLQTRDFIYVKDVARANLGVLDENISGTFHISTGVETSIGDLLRALSRLIGKEVTPKYFPRKSGDLLKSSLKPSSLISNPTLLQEGLKETVDWFAR